MANTTKHPEDSTPPVTSPADDHEGGDEEPTTPTDASGRVVGLKTTNAQEVVLERVREKLEKDELRSYSRARAAHRAFVVGLRVLERELDSKA